MKALGVLAIIFAGLICVLMVVAAVIGRYIVPDEGEKR